MNQMMLFRKIFTDKSTIGKLEFNDWSGWVLEPPERKLNSAPVCIPHGQYRIKIRKNENTRLDYDVPELLEVPGRSDILIHIGNYPKDTAGCLLIGTNHAVDFVSNSKAAFNELMPKIEKALGEGELFINVVG